jgi:rhamnulokinase
VQAMALGELGSLEEAREVVRRSFAPEVYEPGDRAAWGEAYGRFTELFAGAAVLAGGRR